MMIDSFRGGHGFLSNMAPSPLSYEGAVYPTVEHAYQACKSLDPAVRASVRLCATGREAKRLGQRIALRPDWGAYRVTLMRALLALKFAPGTELARQLLATGQASLVEGNAWHDNFWGRCTCAGCAGKPRWNGLGRLLMARRDALARPVEPAPPVGARSSLPVGSGDTRPVGSGDTRPVEPAPRATSVAHIGRVPRDWRDRPGEFVYIGRPRGGLAGPMDASRPFGPGTPVPPGPAPDVPAGLRPRAVGSRPDESGPSEPDASGPPGLGAPRSFGSPIVVGRACPLCGRKHARGETLPCYERWLVAEMAGSPRFRAQVLALRGRTLVCFCKPGPCHGDVLARVADAPGAPPDEPGAPSPDSSGREPTALGRSPDEPGVPGPDGPGVPGPDEQGAPSPDSGRSPAGTGGPDASGSDGPPLGEGKEKSMKARVLCVTGHRPPRLGGYDDENPRMRAVRTRVRLRLGQAAAAGIRTFVSGMAQGVDQVFAEEVLALAAGTEGVRLIAAVPYVGQAAAWPPDAIRRWCRLLRAAQQVWDTSRGARVPDIEAYLSEARAARAAGVGFGDARALLLGRNTWMVDRSEVVLAVWDGSPGGTAHCVAYAARAGKKVVRIDPRALPLGDEGAPPVGSGDTRPVGAGGSPPVGAGSSLLIG